MFSVAEGVGRGNGEIMTGKMNGPGEVVRKRKTERGVKMIRDRKIIN